jgi:uncharacterized protein YecE (DUF72 family)
MSSYYIGTSGWHYEHWRRLFYPEKLQKPKWLELYAGQFNTVEINNSFYRQPSEDAFRTWLNASPQDFTFAVKVNRFITHIKRLKDTAYPMKRFIERARILDTKLGPLLYQLPPGMHRNDKVLESFLATLPSDLKHVFEFRHESWIDEGVFKLLRRYNAGFCVFDMPSLSCPLIATADFAYIRFHGSTGLYWSNYSNEELASWAKKIADLAKDLESIYIYFNNDAEAFAINNAKTLRTYLKIGQ